MSPHKPKSPAGSVQIVSRHNRLQLVFRIHGIRKYISLGIGDTLLNRKFAELSRSRLTIDLLANTIDTTYDKYRVIPRAAVTTQEESIVRLWESYKSYKHSQVSPSTYHKDYKQVDRHLQKCPTTALSAASEIRSHLLKISTPKASKRTLVYLSACCDWAVSSGAIESNPFAGMAKTISSSKGGEIESFSSEERDRIISYFWEEKPQYAPLVEFLFRTGCRPSEAIALQWGDVRSGNETIVFCRAAVESDRGVISKLGLKTQKSRTFPCGQGLIRLLSKIAPVDRSDPDLVFPSPQNKLIDFHNFSSRHWTTALANLQIRHRPPYKIRHTYITHALESGLDAKDIAKICGNSATVIYQKYASCKINLISPDF